MEQPQRCSRPSSKRNYKALRKSQRVPDRFGCNLHTPHRYCEHSRQGGTKPQSTCSKYKRQTAMQLMHHPRMREGPESDAKKDSTPGEKTTFATSKHYSEKPCPVSPPSPPGPSPQWATAPRKSSGEFWNSPHDYLQTFCMKYKNKVIVV